LISSGFWAVPENLKSSKNQPQKLLCEEKQKTKGKKKHTHTHTHESQKLITNILETEITQTCAGGRGGNPSISGYGEESEQEGQSYNSNCSSCNCNTSVSNPIHHLLHNTQYPRKNNLSLAESLFFLLVAFCQQFTKSKIVEHLWIREVIIYQTGKCYLHHFQGKKKLIFNF